MFSGSLRMDLDITDVIGCCLFVRLRCQLMRSTGLQVSTPGALVCLFKALLRKLKRIFRSRLQRLPQYLGYFPRLFTIGHSVDLPKKG